MLDVLIALLAGLIDSGAASAGRIAPSVSPTIPVVGAQKPPFLPQSPPMLSGGGQSGVFNGGLSQTIGNPGGVATNIPTGIGSNSSYVAIVQQQAQAGIGIPIYAAPSIQASQTAQAYRAPQPTAPVAYGGFVAAPASTPSAAPAQPPPPPRQNVINTAILTGSGGSGLPVYAQ